MAVLLLGLGVVTAVRRVGRAGAAPWGRVVGSVLSGSACSAFRSALLINTYILYLFFSKKGRTIFSPAYKDVIAATPEVKYSTSIVIWIFLALVVALCWRSAAGADLPRQ